jgi:beta-lactamase regulating signal transducer with metallopeptidase domain
MGKIKILKIFSFSLLLFFFIFFFSLSIFLIKNVSLNPLKYALFNINKTICSIKCLGEGTAIPLMIEGLRFIVLSIFLVFFTLSLFKTLKKLYITDKFVRDIETGAKTILKFGIKIKVFSHELPLAFTAGFFKPDIYISSHLFNLLEEKELKGIILHEVQHKKNLDPLKNLIISFISDSISFVPIAKFFKKLYAVCTEILADQNCISSGLKKDELALSFLKVCKIGKMEYSWFFNEPFERIKFLFGEKIKIIPSFKKFLVSIIFAVALIIVIFVPNNEGKLSSFLHHSHVCSYHSK